MNTLTKEQSVAFLIVAALIAVAVVDPMSCLLFVVGLAASFAVTRATR
jgi:hypothetical protein